MVDIQIIEAKKTPPDNGLSTVYLIVDWWNDFSFVTMFDLYVHDEKGSLHRIGKIKIGFVGQTEEEYISKTLPTDMKSLPQNYFSLGQDVEYYQNIYSLSKELRINVLKSLNDMVYDPSFLELSRNEKVFSTALLRDVSLSIIKGQFARVLTGRPPLTDFKFSFIRPEAVDFSAVELNFQVKASSTPSTNIHAIIGRNGVGKTTLLNNMIDSVTKKEVSDIGFYEHTMFDQKPIDTDYFSSLVSVSFSAFDPFKPPKEQPDPSKGTCYFYVGLNNIEDIEAHRNSSDLRQDCVKALCDCFKNIEKTKRWYAAIEKLSSDENFDSMNLGILEQEYRQMRNSFESSKFEAVVFRKTYYERIKLYLKRMSSGHAIVLLTISRLVATVEEKTLVLLDEPESHLHPPLLSAFIRALSDLLYDRNGVAIIATHSPVVLQEIPKSCAWKINRTEQITTKERPKIETFAENVGTLTREVFGLEVSKSGFHDLLEKSIKSGKTYEEIIEKYDGQLGVEGRIILQALIVNRDKGMIDETLE